MYIEGTYHSYIVILSIVIAVLAAYLTLSLVAKIFESHGKLKYFWLISASLIMGCGIWSMHFIGMLAFHLPITMSYKIDLTLLSMFMSMVSSFLALYITTWKRKDKIARFFSSFFIGSGILGMHYIGMAAMVMPVDIIYNWNIVTLSAVIAYLASYLALVLFGYYGSESANTIFKWGAAIVLGGAISGMHYTGMAAASFKVIGQIEERPHSIDFILLFGVVLAIFSVLLITWSVMFMERYAFEKMAYHDALTGLPNRREINRFFSRELQNEEIGVIGIDLDDFKNINDTLGHAVGDQLLQEFSARLKEFVQHDRQFFRIGGDEFLCITRQLTTTEIEQLANDILKVSEQSFDIQGYEVIITMSIGISTGHTENRSMTTLLKNADAALYLAKDGGKNQYFIYNCQMAIKDDQLQALEKDLWHAIEKKQLFLVYQPKWDLQENRLDGFEALLRWQHPSRGLILPNEFIPIAEKNGLILPITEWVLMEASMACREWQAKGILQPVSINVSRHSFQMNDFFKKIQLTMKKVGLNPELLGVEITESTIMQDVHTMKEQIEQLQSIGITVSMDNFGTGYSSLSLLDQIPFDELKIDRFFIQKLATPKKQAILQAMITMADRMGVKVIAEGVETKIEAEKLHELGCHMVQGFLYSEPMEAYLIEDWIYQFTSTKIGELN